MLVSYLKKIGFITGYNFNSYKWKSSISFSKNNGENDLLKELTAIYSSLMKNWMITFLNLLLKVGKTPDIPRKPLTN